MDSSTNAPDHPTMLVGTYTESSGGRATGIGVLGPDAAGRLRFAEVAAEASSPSYLAASASTLYAVDEAGGRVEAFRRHGTELEHVGVVATSAGPCHITVDDDLLYVSGYGSGLVDVIQLGVDGRPQAVLQSVGESGSGPHFARDGPHAHATLLAAGLVLTADLGTDRIRIHWRRDGRLVPAGHVDLPAGTGPRDLTLGPDGLVLVLGELDGSLSAIDLVERSIAWRIDVVSEPVAGDHGAALAIGADGRFLYTALRGSDRVAVVDLRERMPVADVPAGGRWPRHLLAHGSHLYVACQESDTVSVFELDPATGIPTLVDVVETPTPTFLLPV